jgi:anti-sigma regulatory factor (Ser/Thr protein kinase)
MLNGITSALGRIHPLPPSPVSQGRGRGIPLEEEGDYRGHGRGRAGEVRAASVVLLPCAPSSVAIARGRIAAELRGAGLFPAAVADAALVTSELLSNAILHARPLPDACVRVSWILTPTSVEIIVSDGGSATRPHASHPSLSSIGGRGLGIVEHVCTSWGVRADERGTTVWAVLPAPRGGGGAVPDGAGPAGGAAGRVSGAPAGDGRPAGAGAAGRRPADASRRADAAAPRA